MSIPHFSYVFDEGYSFPSLVSAHSVLAHSRPDSRVLFLTRQATESFYTALDALRALHPKAQIDLIEDPALPTGFGEKRQTRKSMFWILRLPHLVQTKTLYIDGDTLCLDSLEPLFDLDLQGNVMAAALDVTMERSHYRAAFWLKKKFPDVHKPYVTASCGISSQGYLNSGVILFDPEAIRSQGFLDSVFDVETAIEARETATWHFNDQDWINFHLKQHSFCLHPRWNLFNANVAVKKIYLPRARRRLYREALANPAIAHFTGPPKPWSGAEHKSQAEGAFRETATQLWRERATQLAEQSGLDILSLCNDPYAGRA